MAGVAQHEAFFVRRCWFSFITVMMVRENVEVVENLPREICRRRRFTRPARFCWLRWFCSFFAARWYSWHCRIFPLMWNRRRLCTASLRCCIIETVELRRWSRQHLLMLQVIAFNAPSVRVDRHSAGSHPAFIHGRGLLTHCTLQFRQWIDCLSNSTNLFDWTTGFSCLDHVEEVDDVWHCVVRSWNIDLLVSVWPSILDEALNFDIILVPLVVQVSRVFPLDAFSRGTWWTVVLPSDIEQRLLCIHLLGALFHRSKINIIFDQIRIGVAKEHLRQFFCVRSLKMLRNWRRERNIFLVGTRFDFPHYHDTIWTHCWQIGVVSSWLNAKWFLLFAIFL